MCFTWSGPPLFCTRWDRVYLIGSIFSADPLPDFPIAFASVRQTRGGGKHRYRCPLKDKRYLRAIREPIRIRPEFDGGIRAHFTFLSKRNLKFLPRKRARKLSISRHWSSGRGASFFEMALNGRDLLTTKRFTTDTRPELHSTQCVISVL